MRIMTVGTPITTSAPLPAVQTLAVAPMGPGVDLCEMALGAQAVALVQADAIASPERQQVHGVR